MFRQLIEISRECDDFNVSKRIDTIRWCVCVCVVSSMMKFTTKDAMILGGWNECKVECGMKNGAKMDPIWIRYLIVF